MEKGNPARTGATKCLKMAVTLGLLFSGLKFRSMVLSLSCSSFLLSRGWLQMTSGALRTEPEVAPCVVWGEPASPTGQPPGLPTYLSCLPKCTPETTLMPVLSACFSSVLRGPGMSYKPIGGLGSRSVRRPAQSSPQTLGHPMLRSEKGKWQCCQKPGAAFHYLPLAVPCTWVCPRGALPLFYF